MKVRVSFRAVWLTTFAFFAVVRSAGLMAQTAQPDLQDPEVRALIAQARTLEQSNREESEGLYKKALSLSLEKTDLAGEANSLLGLGRLSVNNDPAGAIERLLAAHDKFVQLGIRRSQAECLRNLGWATRTLARFPKAMEYFTALHEIGIELNDQAIQTRGLLGIATIYRDMGRPSKAVETHRELLTIFREAGNKTNMSTILNNIGGCYADLGDLREAIKSFEESRALARESGSKEAESLAVANLGKVIGMTGETDRGIAYLEEARLLCDGSNNNFLAFVLHEIAILVERSGDLLKALNLSQQALAIKEKIGDKRAIALSLADLSNYFEYVGQFDRAEEYLKRAITCIRETDSSVWHVLILGKAGDFYSRRKRPDVLKSLYEEARAVNRTSESHKPAEIALKQLQSDYLAHSGKYAEARDVLLEALKISEGTDNMHNAVDLQMKIGMLETKLGRYAQGLARFESVAAAASSSLNSEAQIEALARIGEIKERRKDFKAAQAAYKKSLGLIEQTRSSLAGMSEDKIGFQTAYAPVYARYISILVQAKQYEDAFKWVQRAKARTLSDLMQAGRIDISRTLTNADKHSIAVFLGRRKELMQRWLASKGVLDELKRSPQPDIRQLEAASRRTEEVQRGQKQLEAEWRQFHSELYARNPQIGRVRAARIVSSKEVSAILPSDTALFEYCYVPASEGLDHRDELLLFIVSRELGKERLDVCRAVRPKALITRLSRDLREGCAARPGSPNEKLYQTVSRSLYDLLIAPAKSQLRGKKRVIICPDGPLWDVPFQTLIGESQAFGRSGNRRTTFLWEDYSLAYGYSATGVRAALNTRNRANRVKPRSPILIVANPTFRSSAQRESPNDTIGGLFQRDGALSPLPNSLLEAKEISSSYRGAVVKTEMEAQESLVKERGGSFRLIHFATHALINDAAPMLSGIVLAQPPRDTLEDGVLTVRELFGMDLSADMVVFSACETARGSRQRGEGMMGLTWAAFVAGAPAQIVSQWSVDDAATALLMGRFYRELRSGVPKDTALRTAAMALMRNPRYRHPFYWAPFLVMGNWN